MQTENWKTIEGRKLIFDVKYTNLQILAGTTPLSIKIKKWQKFKNRSNPIYWSWSINVSVCI